MNKQEYFPPQAEELLLKTEGALCTSADTDSIPDFDLLSGGDIVWD